MNWAFAGQLVVILVLTFALAFFLYIALDVLWQYGKALYCRTKLRRTIKSHARRDFECDHEYALKINRAVDRFYGKAQLIKAVESDLAGAVSSKERQSVGDARTVTDSPPRKAKGPLLDITSSVPPILNQSEQWLQNARIAESADDFWDGAA